MDMDLMLGIAVLVIAAAWVVKVVFYAIEVLTNAKATKKSLKMASKVFKAYEPALNYFNNYVQKLLNSDD